MQTAYDLALAEEEFGALEISRVPELSDEEMDAWERAQEGLGRGGGTEANRRFPRPARGLCKPLVDICSWRWVRLLLATPCSAAPAPTRGDRPRDAPLQGT